MKSATDLERDLDEAVCLSEKAQIAELIGQGISVREACKRIGISTDRYRFWFTNDRNFRVLLYDVVASR